MNCSPPGSSVHGILQARILEWLAIPFSRGYSWPRDQTWVFCIAGRFCTIWATREDHRIISQINTLPHFLVLEFTFIETERMAASVEDGAVMTRELRAPASSAPASTPLAGRYPERLSWLPILGSALPSVHACSVRWAIWFIWSVWAEDGDEYFSLGGIFSSFHR